METLSIISKDTPIYFVIFGSINYYNKYIEKVLLCSKLNENRPIIVVYDNKNFLFEGFTDLDSLDNIEEYIGKTYLLKLHIELLLNKFKHIKILYDIIEDINFLRNKKLVEGLKNARKKDIIILELIDLYGGIYMDLDYKNIITFGDLKCPYEVLFYFRTENNIHHGAFGNFFGRNKNTNIFLLENLHFNTLKELYYQEVYTSVKNSKTKIYTDPNKIYHYKR